ncbi:hypothetical protein MKW92_008599 [Papaver armeniacum]|nr:hypothetical protein MKW92_008599 [Papaver armeniacum]
MGLVCFVDNCAVRIYNVSTGEATPWIKSSVCIHHVEKHNDTVNATEKPGCYFGFDPATGKHKVIFMWCEGKFKNVPVCEVLTVGENTWRIVNDVPPCKPDETMDTYVTYANGSIYWYLSHSSDDYKPRFEYSKGKEVIEYSNESIMAFDIGSEKFRVIRIPEFTVTNLVHADIRLDEVDGCLPILRWKEPIIKLWIFHDHNKAAYGITNTRIDDWTQESISLPSYLLGNQRIIFFHFVAGKDQVILETYNRDHLYHKPCGVDRNARLADFYSYDRKDKRVGKFKINGISLIPEVLSFNTLCTTHVESLLRVTETELSSQADKSTSSSWWCHHC